MGSPTRSASLNSRRALAVVEKHVEAHGQQIIQLVGLGGGVGVLWAIEAEELEVESGARWRGKAMPSPMLFCSMQAATSMRERLMPRRQPMMMARLPAAVFVVDGKAAAVEYWCHWEDVAALDTPAKATGLPRSGADVSLPRWNARSA